MNRNAADDDLFLVKDIQDTSLVVRFSLGSGVQVTLELGSTIGRSLNWAARWRASAALMCPTSPDVESIKKKRCFMKRRSCARVDRVDRIV